MENKQTLRLLLLSNPFHAIQSTLMTGKCSTNRKWSTLQSIKISTSSKLESIHTSEHRATLFVTP